MRLPFPKRDQRPWLLLDIDGVINPTRRIRDDTVESYTPYGSLVVRADLGPALLAASGRVRLAYCSSWGEDANRYVSPLLGLPELPVIAMGAGAIPMIDKKVAGVQAWATSREARAGGCWIDDEVPLDATYGPIRARRIDGQTGLTAQMLDAIIADLRGATPGGTPRPL